jgi:outer membrane protein TolC
MAMPGCTLRRHQPEFEFDPQLAHLHEFATKIEYPDVNSHSFDDVAATPAPWTIDSKQVPTYWEMTLNEAVRTALEHSQVLRDLGGLVLESPDRMTSVYDYGITATDPRFGIEGALAAFDASFEASTFFEKNDRALNNVFFGGGTRIFAQDLHRYQMELNKTSATGANFAARKIIDYDFNNAPGNDMPNRPWTVQLEAEFRQPLLQGAGVGFNRIAGPNAVPGSMNGVLLARINSDITLSEFEIGVRNLVSDVETAYWELYFAYRDLDAKVAARDRALETWRQINTLRETGRRGGEPEEEAAAREQYFRLEEEVQNALSGRTQDRFRITTLRGQGGVQVAERRLRLLMGIDVNDGRLIRPADEPTMARVIFEWDEILIESLSRREEIRRQKWQVQRRELELVASRNFLLPRLDAVGRYRWRGLGHNLIDDDRQPVRFDNAFQDLTTGDFQEWQLGIEMTMPVGFRRGHAAVRQAELQVARERAMLEQIERDIAHDLSAAVAEVDRAYATSQSNYNRRGAAREYLAALEARYQRADQREQVQLLDLLLDAQRRLADAESAYFRSLLEYSLAIKAVHYQKGSLLEFNQVYLSEGLWPGKAYVDAAIRERNKHRAPPLTGLLLNCPPLVSRGEYEQELAPGDYVEPLPEEEIQQPPQPQAEPAVSPALTDPQSKPIAPTTPSTARAAAPSPAGTASSEKSVDRLPPTGQATSSARMAMSDDRH